MNDIGDMPVIFTYLFVKVSVVKNRRQPKFLPIKNIVSLLNLKGLINVK